MIEDYTNADEDQESEQCISPNNNSNNQHNKMEETEMKSVLENNTAGNKENEKLNAHQEELLRLIQEMEVEEKSVTKIDDAPGPKANFGRVVEDKSASQPFLYKAKPINTSQNANPTHFNQPNPLHGQSVANSIQKNISSAKQNHFLSMQTQKAINNAPPGMANVLDEFKALTQQKKQRRARMDDFEQDYYQSDPVQSSYSSYSNMNSSSYNNSSNTGYNTGYDGYSNSNSRNLPVRTASIASIPTEMSKPNYLNPNQQAGYYGFNYDQNDYLRKNHEISQSQNFINFQRTPTSSNPRQVFKSKAVIKPTILQTQPTAHHPTIRTTPHQIVRPKNNPNQVITVRGSSLDMRPTTTQTQPISVNRNNFYQPSSNSFNPQRNSYVNNTNFTNYNDPYKYPSSKSTINSASHYSQSLDRGQPYYKNPGQCFAYDQQQEYSDF